MPNLSKQRYSPVDFVVINDSNNSSDADAICQAVPEQRPTGEPTCLIKETTIALGGQSDAHNNCLL